MLLSAATYVLVTTIFMGTTIRDKNAPILITFIGRDCSHHFNGDSSYGDFEFTKYAFGASFGLYIVVLLVLILMTCVVACCHLSGKHLFGERSGSAESYRLM